MAVAHPDTVPTHWQAWIFEIKAACFRSTRLYDDAFAGVLEKHSYSDRLCIAPILAESNQTLWPQEEIDLTFVTGKIQNLRIARARLHRVEIPAGKTFSFWRQVGRASSRRGYAIGRELREGCLIPAIGGGLCQLSNAIYDCAIRSGLQILERHPHTHSSWIVDGSGSGCNCILELR